ncbi:uncharacterized protein LOC133499604 [Syngnathoides biaculeatus]|uniref:uncharacterized protein LOC133499604 n=1 Tax=Syngnathoides biaculeatus TaxID=300417 RepID=UPI002ADDB71D|nr:uncharacterized protein LOC133499604 [Syngnathoides biaculeatus]
MRAEIERQSAELAALTAQVRQGLANQPSYADVATATDSLLTQVHVAVETDPPPCQVHAKVGTDSPPQVHVAVLAVLSRAHAAVGTDPLPRHAHVSVSTDCPPTQVHVALETDSPPCHAHVAVSTDALQAHVAVGTDPMPPHVAVQEVATSPQPLHVRALEWQWRPARGRSPFLLSATGTPSRSCPGGADSSPAASRSRPGGGGVGDAAAGSLPSHVAVQEGAVLAPLSHVAVQEGAEEVEFVMLLPPSHVAVQEGAVLAPASQVAVQEGVVLAPPPSHVPVQEELGSSVEPPRSWRDFGVAVMALVLPSIIFFAPECAQPLQDLASLATNPWSSCNDGVGGSRPEQWPASFWFLLRRLVPHRGRPPESPRGDPGPWRPGRPPDLSARTPRV